MEPEGSLLCSQEPSPLVPVLSQMPQVHTFSPCFPKIHFPLPRSFQIIRPMPMPCVIFCNNPVSYGVGVSPSPNPQAGDRPYSAVRDCLFTIFQLPSLLKSRDSSVGIATDCGLDDRGSNPCWGWEFFS
jgi:hypothetical protein